MSLATFKKKTTNKYSSATKRSGKPPGGIWLTQGPFGSTNDFLSLANYGPNGFSLAGSTRTISVGKSMAFSQQGTKYKGIHPVGHGGTYGKYYHAEPLLNASPAKIDVRGNQHNYIKPPTLSTQGMLQKRFRWIHSGQYPNYWVQPVYTGNQTDTKSQGLYIQNLSARADTVVDTNDEAKYVGNCKESCVKKQSIANGYTLNLQQSTAPYTKTLYVPVDSSQRTLRIQQPCLNPTPEQQPFPGPVSNGTGIGAAGTTVTTGGNSCGTSDYVLRSPFF
jgi:hypothetical protein